MNAERMAGMMEDWRRMERERERSREFAASDQ